jgi:hypothetical protein
MKGLGPIVIAVIALILLLTTLTGSAIFLAAKSENILRTARETAIINGINTMEMTKASLRQALAYSSYQAVYDASYRGGSVSNDIASWRVYDASMFQDWKANMGELAKEYLNKYAEELGVKITYNPITFLCVAGHCITKASSDNPLYLAADFANSLVTSATDVKSERIFFQLTDNPSMTSIFKTDIQNMFDTARQTFVIKDVVGDKIAAAKNSLSGCSEATANYCDTTPLSCGSIYPSDCSSRFTNSINQGIQSLKPNEQTDIQPNTRVSYFPTELGKTDNGVDDLCCTRWNPPVCTTDEDGEQTCDPPTCAEPHHLWTISCSYDNYAASKVLVTMTDAQNKYPVYDNIAGTNEMRNTKLNFYIISGSDYSDRTRSLVPS